MTKQYNFARKNLEQSFSTTSRQRQLEHKTCRIIQIHTRIRVAACLDIRFSVCEKTFHFMATLLPLLSKSPCFEWISFHSSSTRSFADEQFWNEVTKILLTKFLVPSNCTDILTKEMNVIRYVRNKYFTRFSLYLSFLKMKYDYIMINKLLLTL